MTEPQTITVEFVQFVPEELAERTLYVSMEFASTSHLCFCGCGNKVVLPLSPTDWRLCFDGRTVSLTPSVGSWDLPCRSHYWITQNQIRFAQRWTDKQVRRAAQLDETAKRAYFAELDQQPPAVPSQPVPGANGLLKRVFTWLRDRRHR